MTNISMVLINFLLQRKLESYCYTSAVQCSDNSTPFILVGSNWNDGENVRAFRVNNKTLRPAFILGENSQRIRCSWHNHNVRSI